MLINTFCHIPRISVKSERRLWEAGLDSWITIAGIGELPFKRVSLEAVRRHLDESDLQLSLDNPHFFAKTMPSALHWRMFPEFRHKMAYLDIETTGMNPGPHAITTIALYDGQRVRTYIQGHNLHQFEDDIQCFRVLVTYNGKAFDIPFIESSLNLRLNHVQLDLCHVLRSLGYRGGLKGCEKQLGVHRQGLEDVDGYFAVLLWKEYVRRRNEKALETLLCYNIYDTVNLETLLVKAYNLKLKDSPFAQTHRIPLPVQPKIPFQADAETIEQIRHLFAGID